jgi:alanine racemase
VWSHAAISSATSRGVSALSSYRPTRVEIDLAAIRHNVGVLRELVAPAAVMAVVKADGYGHGAVPVARAAIDAGAAALGVALVEEGVELRDPRIDAPNHVLSEPRAEAAPEVVARWLTPVVYTEVGIDALAKAVADQGTEPLDVHLKVDTGMHRVGVDPDGAVALAQRVLDHRELRLSGVATHFAVADDPDDRYTRDQLARFDAVRAGLASIGVDPHPVHAANSAAAIGFPEARFDLVRAGIAIYGVTPAPGVGADLGLRPALALRSAVTHAKRLQ